ncbi:MAG TPA: D-alanyl-D-alanine endopeptidase, partial [Ignavibacteriaceae bacterium]
PVRTTMPRSEALLLALMASENRAAHALARTSPQGIVNFIRKMNEKAKSLGMHQTHFDDPTGLSPSNVSTAKDLSILLSAASKYSEIRKCSTTETYDFKHRNHQIAYHNTNPLVLSDDWNIGVSKTGYTQEAGRCLVMQAHVQNRPLRIVLLDSQSKNARIQDAIKIKQWILAGGPSIKEKA